jgi:hypothetical protein
MRLGLCFRADDILTLDGMTIERQEGGKENKKRKALHHNLWVNETNHSR